MQAVVIRLRHGASGEGFENLVLGFGGKIEDIRSEATFGHFFEECARLPRKDGGGGGRVIAGRSDNASGTGVGVACCDFGDFCLPHGGSFRRDDLFAAGGGGNSRGFGLRSIFHGT